MRGTNKILWGDCIKHLRELPKNSVDAIVTDPPYGIGFMGKEWDNFNIKELSENIKKTSDDHSPTRKSSSYQGSAHAGLYDTSIKGSKSYQQFCQDWSKEALRILKPGGFMLVSCSTRMYHRMTCGIEDAGFEIRDTIMWLYGSGFPKSLNIGKQIDKMNGKKQEEFIALGNYIKEQRLKLELSTIQVAECGKFYGNINHGGSVANWEKGSNVPTKEQWIILKKELKLNDKFDYLIDRVEAEREVIGERPVGYVSEHGAFNDNTTGFKKGMMDITLPSTSEAQEWEGWGTALKPACEPIVVARKPLSEKNVALNVLKWGTGGINIDACRVGIEQGDNSGFRPNSYKKDYGDEGLFNQGKGHNIGKQHEQGRFPANIILDEEAGEMLDEQSGRLKSGSLKGTEYLEGHKGKERTSGVYMGHTFEPIKSNKGGASRFFYCAKASKSERNLGCDDINWKETAYGKNMSGSDKGTISGSKLPTKNNHPTVKPIKLMEYLIKLVTKEGATVLDPFLGSGTTAIACQKLGRNWIGIEKESEYIKIAEARIKPFLEQETLP